MMNFNAYRSRNQEKRTQLLYIGTLLGAANALVVVASAAAIFFFLS